MAVRTILPAQFFSRPTPVVAEELLGKFLVRRYRGCECAAMITDVEIYDGVRDKGSHAHRGKTVRNTPMFGSAGHWYIYFTYGIHWLMNIVTEAEGYPAAVLIRGVEGVSGPARVTKRFHVTGVQNGKKADARTGLWIEDRGIRVDSQNITRTARVGIDYAGPYWKKRKWRLVFYPSRSASS